MTDAMIRHYFPGVDPMGLTIHQTLSMAECIGSIESAKAGEPDHRGQVERQARQMRLAHG